jgi:hypothetical protein
MVFFRYFFFFFFFLNKSLRTYPGARNGCDENRGNIYCIQVNAWLREPTSQRLGFSLGWQMR